MAAAMTFYAVKVAARPADESHPYGHETVSYTHLDVYKRQVQ